MTTPTGQDREPGQDLGGLFRRWFDTPPYAGLWVTGCLLMTLMAAAVALRTRETAAAPAVRVTQAPVVQPRSAPAPAAPVVTPAEPQEEAKVQVRTLPSRPAPPQPPTQPVLPGGSDEPVAEPSTQVPTPEPLSGEPGDAPPAEMEPPQPVPPPARQPQILQPAEPPRPAPRPSEAPRPRRRSTGRISVYFDADSSTFRRDDERLPLRVELFIDGVKQIESSDPEKRELELRGVPEGVHEIRIVPHVGDAAPEPRSEVVTVVPGETRRFRAVLHRAHGVARVRKFRDR